MTEKKVYNETCVYTGRRMEPGDKKAFQRFERPNGAEMIFSGVKGVWIGYTYKCGPKTIAARPERTDAERIDNPDWDAQDALVDAKYAERRAEKKLAEKVSPALKNAIDALVPLIRNMSYFDKRSLIEFLVIQAGNKAKRKK